MTAVGAAARDRGAPSRLGRTATRGLAIATVAAIWAICHPYGGISGDSSVYIGRVLADLDPAGLGRDLMFSNDGQSRFSLFPVLARPLVMALGASSAAVLIAGLASACWVLALLALARGLAPWRVAFAMALTVVVLPLGYGQPGFFYFGEAAAVPRPFAEAAVMAALAAILARRFARAGVFLGIAALIHPLMAMAGFGVVAFVALGARPSRGLYLGLLGGGILLMTAGGLLARSWFVGVPAIVDSTWLAMLLERSPYLFPTHWIANAFSPIIVQATTIVMVARRVAPEARRVYGAVVIVAASGILASILLADRFELLLAIQAQLWRATWLLGVVAGLALAGRMARAREDEPDRQIALCLLAVGWFCHPDLLVAVALSGAALALEFGIMRASRSVKPWHVGLAVVGAGTLVLIDALGPVLGYIGFLRAANARVSLLDLLSHEMLVVPLCLLIAGWFFTPPRRRAGAWLIAAATSLVIAVPVWDQRTADARFFETAHEPPGFAALAAGRPPEVLWLEGRAEEWYALGRPQYFSPQQAVSMVFSRPLAMEWHRRAKRLIDLGLVRKGVLRPWAVADENDRPIVTQAALDRFCQGAEAPGTVIVPLDDDAPPFRGMIPWRLPMPHKAVERGGDGIRSYGIVPCAPPRQAVTQNREDGLTETQFPVQ